MTPYVKLLNMLRNPKPLSSAEVRHIKILELLDWFFDLSKKERDLNRESVKTKVDNYLKRASKAHAAEVHQEMQRTIKL